MFCRNCGKKLEEGQLFCASCGTKVGELSGQASVQAAPQAQEQEQHQVPSEAQGESPFQAATPTLAPASAPAPDQYINNTYVTRVNQGNTQNQKKLFSIIGIAALVVLLLVFAPKMLRGVNSSPEAVAKATFSAINKEDPNAMLKLIYKDDLKKFSGKLDKDVLKDEMKLMNTTVKTEFGKDWVKKVDYGTPTAEKSPSPDYGYFKIRVSMQGQDSYLYIKKIGSKYYLDPTSL